MGVSTKSNWVPVALDRMEGGSGGYQRFIYMLGVCSSNNIGTATTPLWRGRLIFDFSLDWLVEN